MCYYNPFDKFYKSQTGAVCANENITFRIKGDFSCLFFCCQKDGQELCRYKMQKIADYFEIELSFSQGLYFYYFDFGDGNYISKNHEFLGELSNVKTPFQLTAYNKNFTVPEWIYGGVIYQIFPDRFNRAIENKQIADYKILHKDWNELPIFSPNEQGEITNNDFFGGDLKGIEKKLSYLSSLGVSVIYLNPIFKAYSNHRYDTGDYMQIDDLLGDASDFKSLIEKAKEHGIKIILDGVFNHTGDDSLYFNKYNRYDEIGAYQSEKSKYFDWYNFKYFPNEYDSWWGIKTLPAVNENNESYIDFITGENGVLAHYTKLGIGGWRLDVVDELPSFFVKKIRDAVKKADNNAIIIGEVWEDPSNKISYGKRREYFQGNELDSTMNYPLKNAIINFVKFGDAKNLSHVIKTQIEHYPHNALHALMNILSTHDTARILTVLAGDDAEGKSKTELSALKICEEKMGYARFLLKTATLLQFTLCGVPSVYYGDEVGMQGYGDPLNRCTFPWGQEDKDIYNWFVFLSSLRKNYSAFKTGDFEEVFCTQNVYIYKRKDENSEVLICLNVGKCEYCFDFIGKMKEIITQKEYQNKFVLKQKSIAIFVANYQSEYEEV